MATFFEGFIVFISVIDKFLHEVIVVLQCEQALLCFLEFNLHNFVLFGHVLILLGKRVVVSPKLLLLLV